jgi:hypothetical protein
MTYSRPCPTALSNIGCTPCKVHMAHGKELPSVHHGTAPGRLPVLPNFPRHQANSLSSESIYQAVQPDQLERKAFGAKLQGKSPSTRKVKHFHLLCECRTVLVFIFAL